MIIPGLGGIAQGFLAAPPFAVNFDGTNDYLLRGAKLTGAADGKAGTLSCWIKAAVDSSGLVLATARAAGSVRFQFARDAGNTVSIQGRNSSNTTILQLTSSVSTFTIAGGWKHILASWDLATATGQLYVNDASSLAGGSTLTNDNIAYSTSVDEFAVGANHAGAGKWNGDMAELWFHPTALDLSVAANRRLFIDGGYPVDLGPAGKNPLLGATPLLYLGGPLAAWHTNKGSGGGFTVTGALTAATAPP